VAALSDISDLINRATGGNSGTPQSVFFHKVARIGGAVAAAPIAGRPASLWRYDGHPGAGAAPGAVAVPTAATVGALPFTNPGGGREKHLVQAWATGLVGGTVLLYDRLLHQSDLSGEATGAQTVQGTHPGSPALTRNTGGVGNFAFVEIYTQIGATARVVTMNYNNTVPTSGRVSPSVTIGGTGFREATRVIMLPLVAGDTGIRSVQSITLSGSTVGVGALGVTVGRPLAYMGVGGPGAAGWRDFTTGMPGIPQIETDACLALLWFPQTVTVPEIFGGYSMVEK